MKDRDPIDSAEHVARPRHDRAHSRRRHRSASPTAENAAGGPQVIARIPRLGRHDEPNPAARSLGERQGRLVGTRLSAWTLVGGVGFLVVAALLPFVVSKTFQSKEGSDSASQQAANRPEVPAPDAPPAPRWSGRAPSFEGWKTAGRSSPSLPEPSSGFAPESVPSVANTSPNLGVQAPFQSRLETQVPDPWRTVPGARSPEALPGGALGSLPSTSPRTGPESYDAASRGGLVNATPGALRDNFIDKRTDYPGTPAEPIPDYRSPAIDPRSDSRTATRPRYGQDSGLPGSDNRRAAYPDHRNYTDYRNDAPAQGSPYRAQFGAQESDPAPAMRAPTSQWPTNSPGRSPDWVSPPSWATPGASNPSSSAPPPAYSPPSYPATGYSALDNWPGGEASVGGFQGGVSPGDNGPARFEGGIERPTARMSNEHTRSSIR
jgi:hypothetical protein